ncbi:MAG: Two-component system response regulator [uncultured Campylobacterales bacterium]|uniref:Two-component system response regulator n=1 Tax=uncultured Campylobacterales bacterium TaxID=352960 RepID=A0A6S6T0S7_9BACT|nr:MAG: Two-component system response regulator [uncultured Campylobacterales bacterium]
MKILLLEDDVILNELLAEFLFDLGYEVEVFFDGINAQNSLYENSYDLLILDVNVPSISGFEIVKKLRFDNIKTPCIFVTSLDDTASVVEGFKSGGDEYIKKPFDFDEFKIRLENIKNRFGIDTKIKLGTNAYFDTTTNSLYIDNEKIQLSSKISQILHLLIQNSNSLVSYEMMYNSIWLNEEIPTSSTIRTYIKELRKYLKDKIQTIKGEGYIYKK